MHCRQPSALSGSTSIGNAFRIRERKLKYLLEQVECFRYLFIFSVQPFLFPIYPFNAYISLMFFFYSVLIQNHRVKFSVKSITRVQGNRKLMHHLLSRN